MLMMVLCRFIGYTTGPASVAAIVQGNIKILLHKKITGPDADEVNKHCLLLLLVTQSMLVL